MTEINRLLTVRYSQSRDGLVAVHTVSVTTIFRALNSALNAASTLRPLTAERRAASILAFAMLASAIMRACFNVIEKNIPSFDIVSQTKRGQTCTEINCSLTEKICPSVQIVL